MSSGVSWKRVGLEGLVIVGSILLAFAIDKGWDQRQEEERARIALQNLEVGFRQNIELIDRQLVLLEQFEERLRYFLAEDSLAAGPRSPNGVLSAIHRPYFSALNGDELVVLLETAAEHAPDASAVWAASARWRSNWREVVSRFDAFWAIEYDALEALAAFPSTRPHVALSSTEDNEAVLRAARGEERLLALAAMKLRYTARLRTYYGFLRQNAERVIIEVRVVLES